MVLQARPENHLQGRGDKMARRRHHLVTERSTVRAGRGHQLGNMLPIYDSGRMAKLERRETNGNKAVWVETGQSALPKGTLLLPRVVIPVRRKMGHMHPREEKESGVGACNCRAAR